MRPHRIRCLSRLTVIGEEVNLAARIEAFSLRGQVLMSEVTYAHCRDSSRARADGRVRQAGASACASARRWQFPKSASSCRGRGAQEPRSRRLRCVPIAERKDGRVSAPDAAGCGPRLPRRAGGFADGLALYRGEAAFELPAWFPRRRHLRPRVSVREKDGRRSPAWSSPRSAPRPAARSSSTSRCGSRVNARGATPVAVCPTDKPRAFV